MGHIQTTSLDSTIAPCSEVSPAKDVESNHIHGFNFFRDCISKSLSPASGLDSFMCQNKFPGRLYYTTKSSQAWFWEENSKAL